MHLQKCCTNRKGKVVSLREYLELEVAEMIPSVLSGSLAMIKPVEILFIPTIKSMFKV